MDVAVADGIDLSLAHSCLKGADKQLRAVRREKVGQRERSTGAIVSGAAISSSDIFGDAENGYRWPEGQPITNPWTVRTPLSPLPRRSPLSPPLYALSLLQALPVFQMQVPVRLFFTRPSR
jgi:hypothetical protein